MNCERIIVAPDSFKGSLTAAQVAEACRLGILDEFPAAEVVCLPLADGGEGTVDALSASAGMMKVKCRVSDPLMRPVEAWYAISSDGRSAVMEMAAASGLTLLSESERDPLQTSTYGTGEMILDALRRGCRRFFIGIGGSATNDAGMGMLRALGYRFADASGNPLEGRGSDLSRVVRIDVSGADPRLRESSFTVACDVGNPLFGPNGAAYVFAPQKGADEETVMQLDIGLREFASVIMRDMRVDVSSIPGAGAAGGLGAAFCAFLGADLRKGIEMVLEAVGFDRAIAGASLIFTGEGSVDAQSLMGKVVSGVSSHAREAGVPVVVLGGKVADRVALAKAGLTALPVVSGPMPLPQAMRPEVAEANVRDTAGAVMRLLHIGKEMT